jgi:hypothetical protein
LHFLSRRRQKAFASLFVNDLIVNLYRMSGAIGCGFICGLHEILKILKSDETATYPVFLIKSIGYYLARPQKIIYLIEITE